MPPPVAAEPPLIVSPEIVTFADDDVISKTRLAPPASTSSSDARTLDRHPDADRQLAAGQMDRLAVEAPFEDDGVAVLRRGDLGAEGAFPAVGGTGDGERAQDQPALERLEPRSETEMAMPPGEQPDPAIGFPRLGHWLEAFMGSSFVDG